MRDRTHLRLDDGRRLLGYRGARRQWANQPCEIHTEPAQFDLDQHHGLQQHEYQRRPESCQPVLQRLAGAAGSWRDGLPGACGSFGCYCAQPDLQFDAGAATVDEGNNWINLSWGPLALTDPTSRTMLGNYAPTAASTSLIDKGVTTSSGVAAPSTDFFGNNRTSPYDIGAIEFAPGGGGGEREARP